MHINTLAGRSARVRPGGSNAVDTPCSCWMHISRREKVQTKAGEVMMVGTQGNSMHWDFHQQKHGVEEVEVG